MKEIKSSNFNRIHIASDGRIDRFRDICIRIRHDDVFTIEIQVKLYTTHFLTRGGSALGTDLVDLFDFGCTTSISLSFGDPGDSSDTNDGGNSDSNGDPDFCVAILGNRRV